MYDETVIDIENNQGEIEITSTIENIIRDCINKTLDMERFRMKTMVSVSLVDNDIIRDVNLEYRDVDSDTDVLSFPMLEIHDIDPDVGAVILGDIMISMEKAEVQAKEYGHSFERELGFLIVHGMLHLLGYDHMEQEERDIMRSREEAILEALSLIRA